MQDTIYQHKQYNIYRQENLYFFDIAHKSSLKDELINQIHHTTFQIDFDSVDLIKEILDKGYRIRNDLHIIDSTGKHKGTLKHWIIASHYDMSLNKILSLPVRYQKRWGTHDKFDLRADNLVCSLVPKRESISLKVWRKWDELLLLHKSSAEIYYCNHTADLDRVLQSSWFSWHYICREKSRRLAGIMTGLKTPVYLYHLVMIDQLYGLPTEKEKFIDTFKQYQAEYSNQKITIDHLDSDPHNNRLNNLFLMPKKDNTDKQKFTKKITLPYFWNSKRIDADTIYVEAGHGTTITVHGNYNLSDYMHQLKDFSESISGGIK